MSIVNTAGSVVVYTNTFFKNKIIKSILNINLLTKSNSCSIYIAKIYLTLLLGANDSIAASFLLTNFTGITGITLH